VKEKTAEEKQREAEVLIGNSAGPRKRNPLVRLVTDPTYTLRVIRFALGLPTKMETEDRRVLEQTIFPYYVSLPTIKAVLFVGCDWYTKHYAKTFFRRYDYWTIDILESSRKYGSKQHIVDSVEYLDRHFPEDRFDFIVFNGVFGFGLDSKEQCEHAFGHFYTRLRPNGHFLFGYTDVPPRMPIPLESIESLRQFKKFTFPPLGTSRYATATPYRHTYEFYRKPAAN
jgi:hypothetical protein